MPFADQLAISIMRDVATALAEDVGTGDLTARLIPEGSPARGRVITREDAVLCGTDWFEACFSALDRDATIIWHKHDGDVIGEGETLCDIHAQARALLTAERAALNFLQLLSATATITRRFVEAVSGTHAKIVDTRKTLPGLRMAQKYAVTVGGGCNHRIGLYDGVLIKENHIIAAGGIIPALERARQIAPSNVFIQVEVETLSELREALDAGAKMVLLDNMTIGEMREAVAITANRAELEASGGVSLDRVRAIADTGVHRISVGSLTKDVRAIDLSLRHVEA